MSELSEPVELSVIVPVGRRHADPVELCAEYRSALNGLARPYELIFVVDGPQEGFAAGLKRVAPGPNRITVVSLTRSFGEATAIMAGFEQSSGQVIVTLPAYFQIDAGELPGTKLAHREILEYPALDLVQPVVVGIEDAARFGNVDLLALTVLPRKLRQPFEVRAHHRVLAGRLRHALEPLQLLACLFFDVFRQTGNPSIRQHYGIVLVLGQHPWYFLDVGQSLP